MCLWSVLVEDSGFRVYGILERGWKDHLSASVLGEVWCVCVCGSGEGGLGGIVCVRGVLLWHLASEEGVS